VTQTRINYIELPASDLDSMKGFYGKAFGWTFVDYGPDYVAFNDGKMDGGFFRSDLKSRSAANGAALIILLSTDLKATEATVKENGAVITKEIFSFPGGRRFHFADPAGNELAVCQTT
jgi:predicted enzyme related to lactoylglutathione lyase